MPTNSESTLDALADPTTEHKPKSTTRRGPNLGSSLIQLRAARRSVVRRLIVDEDRIDVLATQVLGYNLRPFHLDLLAYESARHKTLQLAPRGYGKSTVLNISRCVSEVLRDPNVRILIVSNTQLQAEVFLREIKFHFEHNDRLRGVFGDWVSEQKWDVREILVAPRTSYAKESTISCVGVGGPVVSRHYDVIIADDLIDEDNSRTEGQRDKVRHWFYRSLLPTLEPHGSIHILGTRYHYEDLYGQLITGEYADCHQIVKAIGDDSSTPWPEKFSMRWLERRRTNMGTILFNSQYQNDVEAMKGRIFRADWLRYYDKEPEGLRIYQGVDLAISRKETADYFAVVTIGVDPHQNVYVLDALQRRLSFRQQTELISAKHEAYQSALVLVESNAYQQAQIDELRRTTRVPVREIKTVKDKVTRFLKLSAKFEAGQVLLRREQTDLIEQLLLAPEGAHDDLLDALEFAISGASGVPFLSPNEAAKLRNAIDDAVNDIPPPHWRPSSGPDGCRWRVASSSVVRNHRGAYLH